MPITEAIKPKLHAARTRVFVKADANGDIPTQIEVLRAGMWPEMSNKGMLYITPQDLQQMAANFKAGVGVPGGTELGQLPIDFMHNEWDQAAGWITDLVVNGDVLMATVSWSTAGADALSGGMFKCFSPSFYPSCLGEWCDPEDWSITAINVLVGGALTNIPFFKDLQPIMASRDSQEGKVRSNTLYVDANAKGATMPTLDEVLAKDLSALTDEDKALLVSKQSELTAEQQTKFGLQTAPVVPAVEEKKEEEVTEEQKNAEAVQASIKSGEKVLVNASEFTKMQADVQAMKEKEVTASVKEHLNRGAIKADQVKPWVEKITADASMLDMLKALPDNPVMAATVGKDVASDGDLSATDELMKASREMVTAKTADNLGDAVKKVLASNTELAARYEAERKVN